jgi:acyl-CoA dehydrogenase
MPAELAEEHHQLQELVAKFVDRELMPLEPRIIERDIRGEHPGLTPEEAEPLLAKCREPGLLALDVPEEFGGMNLPAVALMAVNEELWRTIVPFTFPPDSPNLYMLMAVGMPEYKQKYLEPYARGEARSCIAVSEPGAGADPSGMTTRAERVGGEWVVN